MSGIKFAPLDCADDLPQVYPDPSKAIEVPYDAIDGDCQKDNDFDEDFDGFMPDTVVLEGAVAAVDREPGDGGRALDEVRAAGARVE